MPDFITLVTIAGFAGSSLGFWSLGRSINRKGSLIAVSPEVRTSPAVEGTISTTRSDFSSEKLSAPQSGSTIKTASGKDRQTICSLPVQGSKRLIVHDGRELAIVLRTNHFKVTAPIVIGKAQGSAIGPVIERHESEQVDIHIEESLAKALFTGVPLLQPVTDALNIELRHILETPLKSS